MPRFARITKKLSEFHTLWVFVCWLSYYQDSQEKIDSPSTTVVYWGRYFCPDTSILGRGIFGKVQQPPSEVDSLFLYQPQTRRISIYFILTMHSGEIEDPCRKEGARGGGFLLGISCHIVFSNTSVKMLPVFLFAAAASYCEALIRSR